MGKSGSFAEFPCSDIKMPVLFVGHGSPMNAIEENHISKTWRAIGISLPRPSGILVISAHWETDGMRVTGSDLPGIIYDFYGFPRELYEVKYPAPGSPALADMIRSILGKDEVDLDLGRGFDHGCWSVLCRMFENADIPVVQLSLSRNRTPANHYEVGKRLRSCRERGILIIGSGNIVHNLPRMTWSETAYGWASDFDQKIKSLILSGDHDKIVDYSNLANARLAVPTNEHYLPLLYILALQESKEPVNFFNEVVTLGSISMRTVKVG